MSVVESEKKINITEGRFIWNTHEVIVRRSHSYLITLEKFCQSYTNVLVIKINLLFTLCIRKKSSPYD